MPNSAFDVTTVGLQTPENSVYEVYSPTSRVAFINSLNNSNWNNLIAGSDLAGVTGVSVKGTVSLETWADSWNGKGYTHLNIRAESMSDGLNGYYVYKDNQSNTTTFTDMSADATEYANTLYFPHHDVISACYTYWLATPAASENRLMAVKHTGNVLNGTYGSTDVGVRPVIYVPNSVGLDASRDVWTIAE